jgi:hypothetical protein
MRPIIEVCSELRQAPGEWAQVEVAATRPPLSRLAPELTCYAGVRVATRDLGDGTYGLFAVSDSR